MLGSLLIQNLTFVPLGLSQTGISFFFFFQYVLNGSCCSQTNPNGQEVSASALTSAITNGKDWRAEWDQEAVCESGREDFENNILFQH